MVLAAGLVYLGFAVRAVLAPFVLAMAVAFLLEPPVRFLEGRRLPRLSAILLVYLGVAAVVVLVLFWLIPIFVQQLTILADTLPTFVSQVQGLILQVQTRYTEAGLPPQVRAVLDQAIARAETGLLTFIQAVLSGIFGAVSAVVTLILAPFLAFYMLRDRESIRRWVLAVLPVNSRGDTLLALAEMNRVAAGFVRGQLLVALIVGGLVGLVTYALGLPFSAILGFIAGVTNIIPYFGPVIGAVPAVALALLVSPLLALETALGLFLVQQVDSIFLTPRIVGGSVGLHPLVVIFSLLAGAKLFGIVGMLLGVPLVALGNVFLRHVLARLVSDWSR